jgi:hypothetical protein
MTRRRTTLVGWLPIDDQAPPEIVELPSRPEIVCCCSHVRHREAVDGTLAFSAQVLLGAQAVGSLLLGFYANAYRRALGDRGSFSRAAEVAGTLGHLLILQALVSVATFAVLVVWSAQVHQVTTGLLGEPSRRRYSAGFTIGSWFIPLANLMLVPTILAEHQTIADAPRIGGKAYPDWVGTKTRWPLLVWWGLMSAGMLIVGISSQVEADYRAGLDNFKMSLDAMTLGYLVLAVGLSCGSYFVYQVSEKLQWPKYVIRTDDSQSG